RNDDVDCRIDPECQKRAGSRRRTTATGRRPSHSPVVYPRRAPTRPAAWSPTWPDQGRVAAPVPISVRSAGDGHRVAVGKRCGVYGGVCWASVAGVPVAAAGGGNDYRGGADQRGDGEGSGGDGEGQGAPQRVLLRRLVDGDSVGVGVRRGRGRGPRADGGDGSEGVDDA